MKILIFNSSPKAEQSNTHVMVQAFSEGAISAGAEVENIFLANYNIQPCVACMACWFETPEKCVLNDDAHMILSKMKTADLVIFATPLYADNVSGMMKDLMDRMIMFGCPKVELDENNETRHLLNEAPFKMGVISNCGYPEQEQFQVLRLLFKRLARNIRAELSLEIYRAQGSLLSANQDALKPIIDNYKLLLAQAGKEIVRTGRLSEQTVSALEKPLIPHENYNQAMNEYVAKKLASLDEK